MQAASGQSSLADFAAARGSPYLYIPGGQLAGQATFTFTCSVQSSDPALGPGQVIEEYRGFLCAVGSEHQP